MKFQIYGWLVGWIWAQDAVAHHKRSVLTKSVRARSSGLPSDFIVVEKFFLPL